jgi:hypothetical protein
MKPFIRRSWLLIAMLWLGQGLVACVSSSSSKPAETTASAVRILVSNSGIVEISSVDLEKAGLIAPSAQNLSLSLRGNPIPFWYEEQNGKFWLRFWGERGTESTDQTNVYLISTTGQPTGQKTPFLQTPSEVDPQTTAMTWLNWEKDTLYSSHAPVDDPWFWLMLRAPEEQTFSVQLNHPPQSGAGKIEIRLWSTTSNNKSTEADHRVILQINGQEIITDDWQGAGEHWLRAQISEGILKPGDNEITLVLPGIENVVEITYLDEIVLSYSTQLKAVQDRILFSSEDNAIYQLSGFSSDIWIYDIDEVSAWQTNATNGQILFSAQAGHHYAVIGKDGGSPPRAMQLALTTPILVYSYETPANYVVIGSSEMLSAYQPIIELRSQQGWRTWAVDWNSLCDQYHAGFAEPQAIQQFLHFGITTKQIDPNAMVVLLGDASYHPNQQSSASPLLPTFFIETEQGGLSPSDVLITDLNEDGRPDLALGRIPVQNPTQLKIFVKKMITYEKTANPASVLAIADGQEAQFQISAQAFLNDIPTNFKKQLYAPQAGIQGAGPIIQQKLQDGVALIAYFGHGSLKMWGKDRLFTIEDVQKLSNQSYPILLQMTCLSGYFVHPDISSISEELLWQPSGGVIAAISPTGLTFPGDQQKFSKALIEILLRSDSPTVGEALLHAWQSLPDEPNANEVMKTFLLLGDPALRISVNQP